MSKERERANASWPEGRDMTFLGVLIREVARTCSPVKLEVLEDLTAKAKDIGVDHQADGGRKTVSHLYSKARDRGWINVYTTADRDAIVMPTVEGFAVFNGFVLTRRMDGAIIAERLAS